MRNAAGRSPSVPIPKVANARTRAVRLLGVFALALAATGCISDGQPSISRVSGRGATIAFESIDGPPQPVFHKLVETLAAEAVARQINVISREATPSYRVRGYLAAHIVNRRIHIGWVWDVYDAGRRRVLRIADEELGGRGGADAWAAADDAVLRRIAANGMDRIAAFLGGSDTSSPPAEPPARSGVAVAAADGAAASGFAPVPAPAAEGFAASPRARTRTQQRQPSASPSALAAALALAETRR